MKRAFLLLFTIVIFFACQSKFPEYKKINNNLYQKLYSLGEVDEQAIDINKPYVSIDLTLYDDEKVLYRQFKEQIIPIKSLNKLLEIINYITVGDSASFKIGRKYLEGFVFKDSLSNKDFFTAEIKLHKYLTEEDYKEQDLELNEHRLIKKYINKDVLAYKHKQGVYITMLEKGEGEKIIKGKKVRVAYKGTFINGLQFDNEQKHTYLSFKYGMPGQIIPGLQIALNGLKQGDKVKIIIPSQLAFGDDGSSTGIVPPFTSVVYELNVKNVN